jgi:uncharacterized membrane protein
MNYAGTTMSDIPWAAVAPILVLVLALVAYCIVDIARHDVRYLPKWAWIVVCCLFSMPIGAIIYLIVGRDSGHES